MVGPRTDASEWAKITDFDIEINPEVARAIRRLRVEEGCTWRMVSERLEALYPGENYGGGNQLLGEQLCEAAARMLGEDPHSSDWN